MLARRRGPGSVRVSAAMASEGPVEVWQGECLESTLNFGVYHSLVQIASKVSLTICCLCCLCLCTSTYECIHRHVLVYEAQRLMLGIYLNCSLLNPELTVLLV